MRPAADEYQPMEIVCQTLTQAMEETVKRHMRGQFVSDVAKGE
jgi:hypothetical protein